MDNDRYIGRFLDGRYEILEVIGTGGMAVVYKARCHRLNRLVAIKILKDEFSGDEEFRRRFHAESQAVAMLSHPNIMSIYDVSTTEAANYIVMELIDGITLKQYMEKKGVLNWKETLHFAMQIGKALEHAHGRGIVHRDIKPHNVMVLKNGSVKVTDFGIARIMSNSNTLTKEALGSVHYISPEQAKGGRVDNRSDIYSLGVVMYEMMAGRPPFDGESPVSVAIQHINGEPVMPSVLNANIPGGMEQIIMKTMAKDPEQRYSTVTAMLYDLEELRKNPDILFDFGRHRDRSNDETQKMPAHIQTTAERVASRSSGTAQPMVHQKLTPQQRQEQQRRAAAARQEREAAQSRRNRTATMAVVIGSAVAVIGIIIFLVVLFNGGLLGGKTTLVDVPDLLGVEYEELDRTRYPDVNIVLADYDFSDQYAEGQIMDQSPDAGDTVPKGSEVKIWVSMGPERENLPALQELSGATQQAAENYLKALELVPLVRPEHSDEFQEGMVIRTEPGAGEELERGATVIVYVSAGPATKLVQVPNVIGMSVDNATRTLNASGFKYLRYERKESLEDKDEVIELSVEVNTEVDVTTEIIITVSEGYVREVLPDVLGMTLEEARKALNDRGFDNIREIHEENAAEQGTIFRQSVTGGVDIDITTEIVLYVSDGIEETTTPPQPTLVQKLVTVSLPLDRTEPYTLTILFDDEAVVLDAPILPGTTEYTVILEGRGIGYYEIYIDGEYYKSEKVDFDA